jgi:hypothetical protein
MASSIAMTANFQNDVQTRGIHMITYQAWTERDPVGRKLFSVYDSNQYREHILTFGGIGIFDEKSEASAVNYTAPVEGYLSTAHTGPRMTPTRCSPSTTWASNFRCGTT